MTIQDSFVNFGGTAGSPIAAQARIANPNGPGELILIVDDQPFDALLAESTLTREGYQVVIASDGFEALDIYRQLQAQVRLVILDYMMPTLNGSAVFRRLRLIDPEAAVVLTSGFSEPDQLKSMLDDGLLGFLPKPFAKNKLLTNVRSALDRAAARSAGPVAA